MASNGQYIGQTIRRFLFMPYQQQDSKNEMAQVAVNWLTGVYGRPEKPD